MCKLFACRSSNERDPFPEDAFEQALAERFLGLKIDSVGIRQLGADPKTSVISGALLSISSPAILALPPFSSLNRNVTFIDDAIKFALHRELGHFRDLKWCQLLEGARVKDASVQKARQGLDKLARLAEVAISYLPTLLAGLVVSRWVHRSPDRTIQEAGEDASTFQAALGRASGSGDDPLGPFWQNAPLTTCIKLVEQRGRLSAAEATRAVLALKAAALERIRQTYAAWVNLAPEGGETIASAWASSALPPWFTSIVESRVAEESREKQRSLQGLARGLLASDEEPGRRASPVVTPTPADAPLAPLAWDEINPEIVAMIDKLIGDVLHYSEFVGKWPALAQSIATIPGPLRCDIDWPEKPGT